METEAKTRLTAYGMEVLKFCFSCGTMEWCKVEDDHKYRCTKCNLPPNNDHYYVDRFKKE